MTLYTVIADDHLSLHTDLFKALARSRRLGQGATVWMGSTLLATTAGVWNFSPAWLARMDERVTWS